MNEYRRLTRLMIARYGCDCCLHPVYDVIQIGHRQMKRYRCPFDECPYKDELEKYHSFNEYCSNKEGYLKWQNISQ